MLIENAASAPRVTTAAGDADYVTIDSETPSLVGRWVERFVGLDRRLVLPLNRREQVLTESVTIGPESQLWLEVAALPETSACGALVVRTHERGGATWTLLRLDLDTLAALGTLSCSIALAGLAGRDAWFSLDLVGADGGPGILGLTVADGAALGAVRGRSHARWRIRNELGHFASGVYDHPMYRGRHHGGPPTGDAAALESTAFDRPGPAPIAAFPGEAARRALASAEWARVQPGDGPYRYAHRLLGKLLPMEPPNFIERLKARRGPVRLLSLCSGTAAVELSIIAASGVNVEATFVDLTPELIERAIGQLPAHCTGRFIVGNVNDMWPLAERYDIVVCVSGLHHVVELERLVQGVRDCLNPGGELWIAGEQIGRQGNRLWPDAREACNRVMAALPERYRVNAYTKRVDESMPDNDFGSASFEGIRSEEIEAVLDRFFLPTSVYRRNAFMWRLVNQTYYDNYDLANPEDLEVLKGIVLAEAEHWWQGGRPTELHGVYAPRRLAVDA